MTIEPHTDMTTGRSRRFLPTDDIGSVSDRTEPDENRIPDELLPEGVGPAWWDPDVLRLYAEAHCRHRFNHTIEVKAWVVLHLLNERDRARGVPS